MKEKLIIIFSLKKNVEIDLISREVNKVLRDFRFNNKGTGGAVYINNENRFTLHMCSTVIEDFLSNEDFTNMCEKNCDIFDIEIIKLKNEDMVI